MVMFSKLTMQADGTVKQSEIREIQQSAIAACPHCIFVASHYREDGSCKCNDQNEKIMKEWGYKWHNGAWRS